MTTIIEIMYVCTKCHSSELASHSVRLSELAEGVVFTSYCPCCETENRHEVKEGDSNLSLSYFARSVEDESRKLFNAQAAYESFVEKVRDNYTDTDKESEHTDSKKLLASAAIEVSDFCILADDLRKEGKIPQNVTVELSISNSEDSYEIMRSKYVVFDRDVPFYAVHFGEIMNSNCFQYEGLQEDGVKKLLQAIEERGVVL